VRTDHGPYAAWASWLTAFGRGEDLPATDLVPVDDTMGPDMQARVLQRVNAAFVARQDLWSKAFARDQDAFDLTHLRLATTLVQARERLRPLVGLCRNDLLPESARAALTDALTDAVRSTQQRLADAVRRDPALLTVVRDNDLTAVFSTPSRVDVPERPAGRSVIL
jgi:hypothetical protein